MIIAHYINPYNNQKDIEFHLLLILNEEIIDRSICSFKLPLNYLAMLEHATNVLNNFCEQHNLNKQPEELELNLTILDLKYDLPENFEGLQ